MPSRPFSRFLLDSNPRIVREINSSVESPHELDGVWMFTAGIDPPSPIQETRSVGAQGDKGLQGEIVASGPAGQCPCGSSFSGHFLFKIARQFVYFCRFAE